MYGSFAKVYDALMHDVNYGHWALYYQSLLRLYGVKEGDSLLECAMGSGNLSRYFVKRYRFSGLDLSGDMLSIAETKLRKNHPRLYCMDMTKLPFAGEFDALIAGCDAVNYLLTEEALLSFLRGAKRALKSASSPLAFDLSSEYKLKQLLGNNTLFEQSEAYSYIWHNEQKDHIIHLSLEIFKKEIDGRFTRIEENQRQRAWSKREIISALRLLGFTHISVFGDKSLKAPGEKEERWHFIARRGK